MGDRVGLFVMLAVVVILLIGLVLVGPRHTRRGRDTSETLNAHPDETERARRDHPEGAERSHLVGTRRSTPSPRTGGAWRVPARGPSPRSCPRTSTRSFTSSEDATDATRRRLRRSAHS